MKEFIETAPDLGCREFKSCYDTDTDSSGHTKFSQGSFSQKRILYTFIVIIFLS
jgi:hypothetical protein